MLTGWQLGQGSQWYPLGLVPCQKPVRANVSDGASCSDLLPLQQAQDAMRIQVGSLPCSMCMGGEGGSLGPLTTSCLPALGEPRPWKLPDMQIPLSFHTFCTLHV